MPRDDDPAEPLTATRATLTTAAFGKRCLQISGCCAHRREYTQAHRHQNRHSKQEKEDRQVNRDLAEPGKVARSEHNQCVHAPLCRNHAERASHKRKERRLGQELAHQPAAPGAQRSANGKFALPHHRLSEHEICHVRATHE